MNPPENAVALSVDEKTQIQALDRTQPLLPMRPHQVERRTHDYVRHGTTTLFAALDLATGAVTGGCYEKHRAEEFLDFLKPGSPDPIPAAADVSSTTSPPTRRPRSRPGWPGIAVSLHLHFTPTGIELG